VDVVQRADLVDRQLIDIVVAQDIALLRVERSHGLLERDLELRTILGAKVLLVGAVGHRGQCREHRVVDGILGTAAQPAHRGARRDRARPGLERGAPGIGRDLRRAVVGDEQLVPDVLGDIGHDVIREAHRAQAALDRIATRRLERGERGGVAGRARLGEVEVGHVQLLDRAERRRLVERARDGSHPDLDRQ